MKPKTLVILLVILGVLVGAGVLLMHSRNVNSPSEAMGALLFEGLPVNDIASIVIQTPTDAVSLKKGADSWIVGERFGYPADFPRISDLVRTLREAKTGRKFDASDEVVKRLALKSPDDAAAQQEEKGSRIRMADAKGKALVDMVLGNTWTPAPEKGPPEGQYVMLGGGSHPVYLIDKILSSYAIGPAKWLEKSPVQVDAAEIQKIVCLGPDETTVRYTVERPAKGKDLEWAGAPTDRSINRASLNRLAGALSSLQIEDVEPASADSAAVRQDASGRLDYTLFDGRIYRVVLGKTCSTSAPCQICLEVASETPQSQAQGPGSGGQADQKASGAGEKEEKAQTSMPADEVTKENNRLKAWVFTIPEWQYQAFVTAPEQLFEAKAEKKVAPGAPAK